MNRPLVIAHTIASILEEASGPSYTVPRLCQALAAKGDDVAMFTVGRRQSEILSVDHVSCTPDYEGVPILRRLRFSSAMRQALAAGSREMDVIHNHGLWQMPNVYPAWTAKRGAIPFIVSPRGMLGPAALQFSKWPKRLFWIAVQGRALRSATCLHATSELEYSDIRSFGLRQAVAIVPNGVDLPDTGTTTTSERSDQRTVLSLGRIHRKKGLDSLLRAWGRVADRHPEWRLRIVGPSERGHALELSRLVVAQDLRRVTIEGPLFGPEKVAAYCSCDLFVLPTLNDNFAMTVAEALAIGRPVIATKGAPWAGLVEHDCGWWIDHGDEALAAALHNAMAMPRWKLADMGSRGQNWMEHAFSWDAIAAQMREVYTWAADLGDKPACVRCD